ncbi:MAG: carbohydrate kinase family protein [Muribaculaceae bacterium]|nr:carbohydrate kinase family protein [Muribaculaceae bacterium]
MKGKIIIIGEAWLEIGFKGTVPDATHPGGAHLNAARRLAADGHQVIFLSEIGTDKAGTIVADSLTDSGVDISASDRHIAKTPVVLDFDGSRARYSSEDDGEGFDIIWPRVEREDIVVFGGYMAVDQRVRRQLWSFIANADEREATIIYVPDVADDRISRITKVMPLVYENLEIADRVITLPDDLMALFSHNDPERARRENFAYYVDNYTHLTDRTRLAEAIVGSR